jgi:hypothetical protein
MVLVFGDLTILAASKIHILNDGDLLSSIYFKGNRVASFVKLPGTSRWQVAVGCHLEQSPSQTEL